MNRFVLITRHPADCAELQGLLKDSDISLRPYPVFRLENVDDEAGWTAALSEDPQPSWLIMASPRAPQRFVGQCAHRRADELLDLRVAVVGEGTAKASVAAGLTPEIVGPGTGLGLAEDLNERWGSPTTTIFACGHDRRPELPDALTNAGHRVLPVEVYRMRPTPPRELPPLGPSLEAVIVTSPRAARLYLDGVGGRPLPCPHWALGPTTQDAARSMGIECLIPPEPNLESLAEELCKT